MCDYDEDIEVEINSPEELEIYIEHANLEELYVLRQDLIAAATGSVGDDE